MNNDGHTSPIDALLIINMLNSGAGGSLIGGGEGESKVYPDTNNDGRLSPIDALGVINALNSRNGGGEGEGGSFFDVPEIRSATVEFEDHSNSTFGSLTVDSTSPIYGPLIPANYSLLTDSLFDTESEDEMESVLDELADDIQLNWTKGLA